MSIFQNFIAHHDLIYLLISLIFISREMIFENQVVQEEELLWETEEVSYLGWLVYVVKKKPIRLIDYVMRFSALYIIFSFAIPILIIYAIVCVMTLFGVFDDDEVE